MEGYVIWAKTHIQDVISAEEPFACEDGYGGRIDMAFWDTSEQKVLADVKTQSTKPKNKIRAYPEYGMQLAAYAHGLKLLGDVKLWNIIVSSTEPGRVEIYDWTDQGQRMMDMFHHALELWIGLKNYDPREIKDGTETS